MHRILHVVGRMNRAGAETMLMNLYRKLDRNKFQFDFLYFTNEHCDYDDEILDLGGRIFRIPGDKYKNPITRTWATYKLFKKEKTFYAIQCHQMFSNALHLMAGYYGGITMRIAHSHNTSDANSNKLIGKIYHTISKRLISSYATHFIACGENAGKFLFPKNDNVTFLPNAIDLNTFINEDETEKQIVFKNKNLNKDSVVITQIGRLSEVKNHVFTLKLAEYLKLKNYNFHLAIVGSGHLEHQLKTLTKELKLENHVTFCGVRNDIDVILKNSSLMLMPSLFEGFPVVLVESQACGTPALISSNISPEVDLEMGLIEFCRLEDDLEAWFNSIKNILNKPSVEATVREQVLSEKGFNINLSVKKLELFYGK
ncbi:glycosyltransferase [Hwangdonia sp.]|uniref:glycosyltransferase n=1 Tax=Hwangdonia sp. TaxID=1883432 RepID=UPI003AB1394B